MVGQSFATPAVVVIVAFGIFVLDRSEGGDAKLIEASHMLMLSKAGPKTAITPGGSISNILECPST